MGEGATPQKLINPGKKNVLLACTQKKSAKRAQGERVGPGGRNKRGTIV